LEKGIAMQPLEEEGMTQGMRGMSDFLPLPHPLLPDPPHPAPSRPRL
jgi:hypothetical protein